MDFFRTWTAYKQGFGSQLGKFWPGNDNIHILTARGRGTAGALWLGGCSPQLLTLLWAMWTRRPRPPVLPSDGRRVLPEPAWGALLLDFLTVRIRRRGVIGGKMSSGLRTNQTLDPERRKWAAGRLDFGGPPLSPSRRCCLEPGL